MKHFLIAGKGYIGNVHADVEDPAMIATRMYILILKQQFKTIPYFLIYAHPTVLIRSLLFLPLK